MSGTKHSLTETTSRDSFYFLIYEYKLIPDFLLSLIYLSSAQNQNKDQEAVRWHWYPHTTVLPKLKIYHWILCILMIMQLGKPMHFPFLMWVWEIIYLS